MTETVDATADAGARNAAATRRAARGSLANLAGAAVSAAATFALTVVVTRGISRPAAGVFFTATSLFLLATSVGQLGSGSGLVYFLSRCRARGTQGLVAAYLRAALRPVLVSGVAMGVATFVFAGPIAGWILPGHPEAATYLRVLAVFVPLVGVENVALAASRGMGTMRANVVVEQVCRPLLQLALVAAAVAFSGVAGLGWAWAAGYAPAAAAAWWWWRRNRPRADRSAVAHPRLAGDFWRFTAPRSLASVAQQAMQRLDIVLVGALAGAVPAAVYAAATRFVVLGQMGRNAVSLAVQPQLAVSLARSDRSATNVLYQTSTAWLMAVTWPVYLVLTTFGGPLLHVFGSGYRTGATVLVLLALSMLVATFCGDVDVMLIMAGRTSWSLINVATAFGVNLGLDLWLIPTHGVLGAAVGWAVAIAVKNLSALIQVALVMRLHPFGRMTLAVACVSVAGYGVVPLLTRLALGPSAAALAVALVLGSFVYAGGLWTFRRVLRLAELRRAVRRHAPAQGG
jgi:O-antigen/teichoic acid export membrane protein